jgi:hypothetical protein
MTRRRAVALLPLLGLVVLALGVPAQAAVDYPARDSRYHTYAEMRAEIRAIEAAHPNLVRVFSIGRTHQGRQIVAVEISDRVGREEGEPEVLFDALHHAREHLTPEMALYIINLLVDRYGTGGALGRRITRLVDTRRIWIVPMVNPDGLTFDLSGGSWGGGHYRGWRKNRQPVPGSRRIGTDLNRNYDYRWGCCGGSSGRPRDENYRGPRAWSAPEVRAVRDFVLTRKDGAGRPKIRMHITFHSAGELVLWPYGYTYRNLPRDMTRLDFRALRQIGIDMADTNGYTPQQSSDLYITDGDQIDWLYAQHRIFSYTFEMYPTRRRSNTINRFYPPDELIGRETSRNRAAVLMLISLADCPYRAIGEDDEYCGPFFDDLEITRGWRRDADGSDTARSGLWARGTPRGSTYQLASVVSGQAALVTGLNRGRDLDGGRTTVRSPAFRVPAGSRAVLKLRYALGIGPAAQRSDRFRVLLVDARTGERRHVALEVAGSGTALRPRWQSLVFQIPVSSKPRRLAIQLVAADSPATDATFEVAVDNPRVTLE